ncbi:MULTISPECIES: acyl-CoA dehydrogenase family protein [Mycolicibacterium]|jgi:alkylation response protein AidB-like acyl-CoA dehydrogenase|uniref:Acyl-CoA dehydrogenase domain protein n=1 Tax=Mycolicibacterium vanbaalenii (strain DSM 7251 / JCM 13017 / BCRC 16820 / KCTC 9966 / NRRL B-24157 / PYR-1) TaxID=350058 RepID=A1T1Y9_MYCVP|nr:MULTISPECIES: acyl-CoA dehydrogenase family protein [Mycolicibacterium]ABM11189.1 acyl-CoA dehydrogenase domain protein [Mycolicibacterium vanbaalenii PYR-1]MCV7128626.1 acyl-CoA/acyl-ACP dehydrogenase [Mycolicibacterium vanbaalenii PYR-1]MDW5611883.1 acyl-CoA dehydrogenase family protein [Mycolicibacterium sp. D5.8-2]
MDFLESPEHRDLRQAVGAVTDKYGPGYFAECATAGEPTTDLWQDLAAHGFIGISLPEEFGGGGAGMAELAIVCEETAAHGCPLLLLLVSSAISGELIARYGSAEQRQEWLPRMASGETKVVFAITEPDAGSNTHKISTTAQRDGDDYVITGTKYYISGVDEAGALIVVARTAPEKLSLFLVPTDAPGLVAHRLPVGISLPEKQFTLHFDNVRLPATSLVGTEHEGFRQVFDGLNPERITGAAVCLGVGRHAIAKAADYARVRSVWGPAIGSYQAISHPLAQARIEVDLAAMMTAKAAWLYDNGHPAGEASNMAKYAAAEAAVAAADQAIQTHGGNGLSAEYGLLPQWGLARLLRIAPVSREMILNYVAQHTLALPRSY